MRKSLLAAALGLAFLSGCASAPIVDLPTAAGRGDSARVQALLDQGQDVNQRSKNGATPLIIACVNGHLDTIKRLLDRGADVNAVRSDGYTALIVAVRVGNPELVRMLLSHGADVDLRSIRGQTALDTAHSWLNEFPDSAETAGWREIVRLLKEAKANQRARALEEKRPMIEASEKRGDAAAASGDVEEALSHYGAALKESSGSVERRLREKIIRFALSLKSPPAIPEEAKRHMAVGKALVKEAQDSKGYARAAVEMGLACDLAPWWALAYFNRGLIQEKAGLPKAARRSFALYLAAAPEAADAEAVKSKMYALEAKNDETE